MSSRPVLFLAALALPLGLHAQQSADVPGPDSPPELAIRRYVQPRSKELALYEKRTDPKPVMQWSARQKLYVQTAPDTIWFRVLVAGNSYFVRQRDLPIPGNPHVPVGP